MPWKTIAALVVCFLLVFFALGLFQDNQPSHKETSKETSDEVVQSSSSSRLPEPSAKENTDIKQAEASSQPQSKDTAHVKKHIHSAGGNEGCAHCEAGAPVEIVKKPISLAVSNLQTENSYAHVSSLLSKTEGVTVGHVCAESSRIDLLYAPSMASVGEIRETLAQAGITVDGSLVTMGVDGPIKPEQEQQLKKQLEILDGVTLRSVSGESGYLELVISNAKTTPSDIARVLSQHGYTVKGKSR